MCFQRCKAYPDRTEKAKSGQTILLIRPTHLRTTHLLSTKACFGRGKIALSCAGEASWEALQETTLARANRESRITARHWNQVLGRGCDTAEISEEKRLSLNGSRHSVNEGISVRNSTGKAIQWRGSGHSSESPDSKHWKLLRSSPSGESAPNTVWRLLFCRVQMSHRACNPVDLVQIHFGQDENGQKMDLASPPRGPCETSWCLAAKIVSPLSRDNFSLAITLVQIVS